ncbi:unnamed protein product, partial [Dovyalis caffra]
MKNAAFKVALMIALVISTSSHISATIFETTGLHQGGLEKASLPPPWSLHRPLLGYDLQTLSFLGEESSWKFEDFVKKLEYLIRTKSRDGSRGIEFGEKKSERWWVL